MTSMIKPGTPPPYSSAEPNRIVVPNELDTKVHPTPPEPPLHIHPQRGADWQTPLQNLEHPTISYQQHTREDGAMEPDVERLAQAMDDIADNHPNPKVKAKWRRNANKLRKAESNKREGAVIGILKGLLILLTSPFYLIGVTFLATGMILDGIGFFLKSTGQLFKKLAYTGGSRSRSSESVNTTSSAQ